MTQMIAEKLVHRCLAGNLKGGEQASYNILAKALFEPDFAFADVKRG